MQLVTLLFEDRINPDFQAIKERVSEILGEEISSSPVDEAISSFLIFYNQHEIDYSDKSAPAQTAFMIPDEGKEVSDFSDHIAQSWSFPEAQETVSRSKFDFAICEFMARALEPQVRLKLFHSTLQAAVEVCNPIALVFQHSSEVVSPSAYLETCHLPPEVRSGSINIRFFNVSGSNGEMIMDSRGLEEIGLPDLQCHFQNLDPNDVSRVLYNTAVYIVENGDVIESGQTIAGRSSDEMWECQFEESMLEPSRTILDVNPGLEFSAGERSA